MDIINSLLGQTAMDQATGGTQSGNRSEQAANQQVAGNQGSEWGALIAANQQQPNLARLRSQQAFMQNGGGDWSSLLQM